MLWLLPLRRHLTALATNIVNPYPFLAFLPDAKAVANTYKSKYTETSAALNHNVDELLVGILTQIRLKLQTQVKVGIYGNYSFIHLFQQFVIFIRNIQ